MSAVNGTRAVNGTLAAGIKDVTPEELNQLSHGVQIIDENKEFTYSTFMPSGI